MKIEKFAPPKKKLKRRPCIQSEILKYSELIETGLSDQLKIFTRFKCLYLHFSKLNNNLSDEEIPSSLYNTVHKKVIYHYYDTK